MSEIKPNTCPYCGAPYTLADGGCRAQCPEMTRVHQLIDDACKARERRDLEEYDR